MKSQIKSEILLSTAYLPPISYMIALIAAKSIFIEQYENYLKQSYRNRCKIYAANGVLDLSIPIIEATRRKILMKEVKIDYSVSWQKQHFKSIESAYRTSPFFDYLFYDFLPFYEKPYTFLLDFNMGLLDLILEILQVKKEVQLTEKYEHQPTGMIDLRNYYTPKKGKSDDMEMKKYPQVFLDKYGFQADLSCIDLIFNLGPQAYTYLVGKY